MPLFRCDKCGCVDNSACAPSYWTSRLNEKPPICTECETGEWHEIFPKKQATGMLVDQEGHLWGKSDVKNGLLPTHCKIVGEVGL